MFSINCLEITEDVSEEKRRLYRNLDKGYYLFNDYYRLEKSEDSTGTLVRNELAGRALPDDFFGRNINIQAIVGKNGSGKSSILNLIYMAVNNYSYMFDRDNVRPVTEKLHYVPGLHIVLYFSIDENEYKLECSDKQVILHENENKLYEFELKLNAKCSGDEFEGKRGDDLCSLILKNFYTIVSNYSMQSFLPSDNSMTGLYEHVDGIDRVVSDARCWIDGVFHKNDGYVKSIVLNPFRDHGKIDGEKEIELSKDRLCSLMIFDEQKKRSVFGEYTFNDLESTLNSDVLKEKLLNLLKMYSVKNADKHVVPDVCDIVDHEFSKCICGCFTLEYKNDQSVFDVAMTYLQIKIATLIKKYERYAQFEGVIEYNLSKKKIRCKDLTKVRTLLDFIYNDESHLTKKIWRTVNFLRAYSKVDKLPSSYGWSDYVSNLRNYYVDNLLSLQKRESGEIRDRANPFGENLFYEEALFIAPESIDKCLPPPFFNKSLRLNKKEKDKSTVVAYNNLSSGELQLLQTLSIHLYHIENILSIREYNRFEKEHNKKFEPIPEYRCVNLIFDEIEICFHPEYQRCFIQRFISMLNMMRINNEINKGGIYLNIILVTHSPFVLSDIPSCNVLYLPKDSDSDKTRKNAFAGNIAEMFYESFFLEHTIGAFAYDKVKNLIKSYQDGVFNEKTKKNNELIKKCIGDTVVRSLIEKMNWGCDCDKN